MPLLAAVSFGLALLGRPLLADCAPTGPAGAAFTLNEQLSSIAGTPDAPRQAHVPTPASPSFARPAARQTSGLALLHSPALLAVAARLTSAERLLHYRHGGVDADLWGVFGRTHVVKLGYSVKI